MNITYENNEVVVRIPCGAAEISAAPASKSGKSRMVASTGGFVKVDGAPEGVRIGVNLIAK